MTGLHKTDPIGISGKDDDGQVSFFFIFLFVYNRETAKNIARNLLCKCGVGIKTEIKKKTETVLNVLPNGALCQFFKVFSDESANGMIFSSIRYTCEKLQILRKKKEEQI